MRQRNIEGKTVAGNLAGGKHLVLAIILCFCASGSSARQGQTSTQKQDIPDAPSAVRPVPTPAPEPIPAATPDHPRTETPDTPPSDQPPPVSNQEALPPPEAPPPTTGNEVPRPTAPQEKPSGQDALYKFVVITNEVIVPVRVTDNSGARIDGLIPRDFSVYEDGKKQTMNFFTSDPVALSAAVIIDLGMPDVAVQRINQTFPALESAFSPYDEVSLYTYSTAVSKQADFGAANRQLTARLTDLKTVRGRSNGPQVTGGPLGPQGPTINNKPVESGVPAVITPEKESHVLNDAILQAALDLSKRDKTRRRIIFVISEGREYRSTASYRDVLRVLLTNGITVYAVAVEGSAIPGYNKLERIHLPRFGYSDILPKYANATAGQVFTDFSRSAIESTYARATSEARNEYTVGYLTRATPSEAYRQIEVRVARPDVKVYAKDGYYPTPPSR